MIGMVAKPYIGIASGSPCVVPSWDRISPSTNRSEGLLYELMSMVAIGGQEVPNVVQCYLAVEHIESICGID